MSKGHQKLLYEENIIKDKSEEKEPQKEKRWVLFKESEVSSSKSLQNPPLFQKDSSSKLFFFFWDEIRHDVLFKSRQSVFLFSQGDRTHQEDHVPR